MTEIHLCAKWFFLVQLFYLTTKVLNVAHPYFRNRKSIKTVQKKIILQRVDQKLLRLSWVWHCRSNGSEEVRFETWARDVAVGRVVNTAAMCSDGDGPAGKRRREREREQALLLLCPWLPTAVFRSPYILTVFLGHLADAILSSTHQHLFCFQCQSLGRISVCRSMWIVGINRGGKARRALFLWTLFGKRNVIQLHFQLSHSPPTTTISAKNIVETVANPPVRELTVHVICLLACGCCWFCV